MMNPYYNQAVMNYNMQMRNADPNQKNDDKTKKQYPMYYPNPWSTNPYMMPPPSSMMCPPDQGQGTEQPRQPMPPNSMNPYPMMQNPNGQKGNPNMPPPRMYVPPPYQMDARYYMPYPPPQFMPKKGE